MNQDRNLLFGVLAIQLRLLTPQKLVEAAGQWAVSQERPLSEILIQLGCLSPDKVKVIDDLIALQVKEHQGDVHATLMTFGGERAVHESFAASILVQEDKVVLTSFGGETPAKAVEPEAELSDQEHLTLEHPGRYSLKGEKGRGGIGRVLIAFDQHIGREIAIKELLPEKGPSGTPPSDSPLRKTGAATARFLREARITGQLEHPGIVPVYELGKHSDGSLYYTMKLVRGKTLAEKLHECKSLRDRLQLLPHYLDLCQTMAYAHSRGVIHRDIKPQNVMVGEFGETVVLDWGLAKVKGQKDIRAEAIEKDLKLIKEAGAGETVAGKPIGTPAYMSPEQADGRVEDIDEQSDVWSLGAVLYEILTGKPPFEGVNAYEVMGKVLKEPVKPVREIEKEAPAELVAVIEKCLNRDQGQRYLTAKELSEDIAAFQSGGLVSAYHYSLGLMARRWVNKRWPIVATASTALFVLVSFGIWSFIQIREQRNVAIHQKAIAETNERKVKENLARAYLIQGQWAESQKAWNNAKVFYSQSLTLHDSLQARYSLNYVATVPEVSAKLFHSLEGLAGRDGPFAFSPDGKTLVSGEWDSEGENENIKLWNISSGKLIYSLKGHRGITCITFSQDGKILASGGYDNTVKIWDVSEGKPLHSLEGHNGTIVSIAFSPDSKTLVSESMDKTIRLWNVAKGIPIYSITAGIPWTPYSTTIAFSPDGKTIASGILDNMNDMVKIWDSASGKLLHSLKGHTNWVSAVAFSPDGKTLASGGWDDTIKLWDPSSGKLLDSLEGHTDIVRSIVFSPDGKLLASRSNDKTVKLWDTASGKLLHSLEGHTNWVSAVAFSPDGKTILSASKDGTIKLFNIFQGNLLHFFKGHTDIVNFIAFSPDGKTLASGGWDQTVKLWEFSSGKVLHSLDGHKDHVIFVIFSPNGKTLASESKDGMVKLWEVATGNLLFSFEGKGNGSRAIAFSPDGNILALGSRDSIIKLWDLSTGELLNSLVGHTKIIKSITFSPDGKILASGGEDKTVKLWDISTSKLLYSLTGHNDTVYFVSFSPDGKILASGGSDRTIKLWDISTSKLLYSLTDHNDTVYSVSFSPDGKILASASFDGTIKLWDVSQGTLLHSTQGPNALYFSVAFSPDGKTLAWTNFERSNNVVCLFFLDQTMKGDPQKLLEQAERETGLKVEGMRLYPWNPETGKVSETPIPQSF